MTEIHHTVETLFVLVITMFGNDGSANHPIGHIQLNQPMLESQCQHLLSEGMFSQITNNEFYFMHPSCEALDCEQQENCS